MKTTDFKNKVLSISTSEDSYNHDLISPVFEEVSGRVFITGKIPKESTETGWSADKVGAIAWDIVTEYVVFDTYEEYIEATKKSDSKDSD